MLMRVGYASLIAGVILLLYGLLGGPTAQFGLIALSMLALVAGAVLVVRSWPKRS